MRAEQNKKPAVALSRRLQEFYGTHLVSPWQKARAEEIRNDYQEKQQGLDVAHNIASSRLAEEYMGFELEYLETSHYLKEKGDGHEPFHRDARAVFQWAFYKWLGRQAGMDRMWGKFQYARTRARTHIRRAFA